MKVPLNYISITIGYIPNTHQTKNGTPTDAIQNTHYISKNPMIAIPITTSTIIR